MNNNLQKKGRSRWLVLATILAMLSVVFYLGGGHLIKAYLEWRHPVQIDRVTAAFDASGIKLEFKSLQTRDKIVTASFKAQLPYTGLFSGDVTEIVFDSLVISPRIHPETPIIITDLFALLEALPLKIRAATVTDLIVIIPASDVIPEKISISGKASGRLTSLSDSYFLADGKVAATSFSSGGDVKLSLDHGVLMLDGNLKGVRLPGVSTIFNFYLHGENQPQQAIAFHMQLADQQKKTFLAIDGTTPNLYTGQLTFKMPSYQINEAVIPIKVFGVESFNHAKKYGFTISGAGGLNWEGTKLKTVGGIDIQDGYSETDKLSMSGLTMHVPLEGIYPVLNLKQDIDIKEIKAPVGDASQVKISLQVSEGNVVMRRASCSIWDGTVYMGQVKMLPQPEHQQATLVMEHISLEHMANHLDIKNFKASGLISGQIPMTLYDDGSVAVTGGDLKSAEPGHLSYQWDEALDSGDSGLQLAGKAIQNFEYEDVHIKVDKKRHQEPLVLLDIKGKNPKLFEGRQFDIRINLSGKLLQALEGMVRTFEADINELKQAADRKN